MGPVPEDKLPKDATPGRMLTGTLALAKKAGGNGEAPGRVPLRYMCALLHSARGGALMQQCPLQPLPCAEAVMSCQCIGDFLARLGLVCDLIWRTLSFMMCCCDPCSVPPKVDADSKDASKEVSKADDEEKSPATRLQEAVRDSKVTQLLPLPLRHCSHLCTPGAFLRPGM